jgi:hypothetical protein
MDQTMDQNSLMLGAAGAAIGWFLLPYGWGGRAFGAALGFYFGYTFLSERAANRLSEDAMRAQFLQSQAGQQ